MELKTLENRAPTFGIHLLLATVFILTINTFLMGETLFFGVSPFDTTYKLSTRYDFSFWKFKTKFKVDVELAQKQGFIKITPKFADGFEYFEFINDPYRVTYSDLNIDIPFTTFVNPAKKGWYATWVNTGYFSNGYIHKNDYFSILSDVSRIHLTFKMYGLDIFLENSPNGITLGAGNKTYLFIGEKTGLGVLLSDNSFIVYTLVFYENGSISSKFGFTLKTDNLEINLINDEIDGQKTISGKITLKVGDLYVIGRLQGKEVCLDFEFPIW